MIHSKDTLHMYYLVQLERGVWLAPWDGDPGRTHVRENARRFATAGDARTHLRYARYYRTYPLAKVIAVK